MVQAIVVQGCPHSHSDGFGAKDCSGSVLCRTRELKHGVSSRYCCRVRQAIQLGSELSKGGVSLRECCCACFHPGKISGQERTEVIRDSMEESFYFGEIR